MVRLPGRSLLTQPLPRPPGLLRLGPLRAEAFSSRLHDERVAARLGLWLGITFSICFVTGLISHGIQHPPSWFLWPSRPVNLYRVTQGLHVLTGLASIPLLLAKLWTVYPKLWEWPPLRDVAHAVERASLFLLVAGATFQLFTGLINIAYWYPFRFFFTTTHYWTAWITMGALVVHVGTKIAVSRRGLSRSSLDRTDEPAGPGLSRRGLLRTVGLSSGAIVALFAGSTVPQLRRLDLLAPRRPDIGPQGLPVNKTARAAKVQTLARDPAYRLTVEGDLTSPLTMTLGELRAMPQTTASLPIACVEGWSASAVWTGVRLRDLLDRVGAKPDAHVRVESLEKGGLYRSTTLNSAHARDPLTMLATELHGQELDIDHGYPCRLITPNQPGVLQTKWVTRVTVL